MKTTKSTRIPALFAGLLLFAALAFTACKDLTETVEVQRNPVIRFPVEARIAYYPDGTVYVEGTADIFAIGSDITISQIQTALYNFKEFSGEDAISRVSSLLNNDEIKLVFESDNPNYEGYKILDERTIYYDAADLAAYKLAGQFTVPEIGPFTEEVYYFRYGYDFLRIPIWDSLADLSYRFYP